MGIKIIKSNIVTLGTDAIVNAANSSLAQGSGVCGAIFDAAGSPELTAACNRIGGCNTGSAVITPGFKTRSRFIIHAVGPIWHGGSQNEPQLLYSAYKSSLKLAIENGCRSIGFPLISSGVYGYPKDGAWCKALQACLDFLKAGKDIEIVFAVLDDEILKLGLDTLKELTGDAAKPDFCCFHNPDEPNGFLSNWYLSDFTIDGMTYSSMEQYMMYMKAVLFEDDVYAAKILATDNVAEIKDYGRAVRNFNPVVWNGMRQIVIYKGLLAKYSQNETLKKMLLDTGDSVLVECAAGDKIWACGQSMTSPHRYDMNAWDGQNLLGFATMLVREELRQK